jgi:hypothetical protein
VSRYGRLTRNDIEIAQIAFFLDGIVRILLFEGGELPCSFHSRDLIGGISEFALEFGLAGSHEKCQDLNVAMEKIIFFMC